MIPENLTPRPNVAAGAVIGLLASLLLAFLQVYQAGAELALPADIPVLLATFNPLVMAVVAYLAPAFDKTVAAAIAALGAAVLIIALALLLAVPIGPPLIVALINGALTLVVTAAVPNSKSS